MSWPDFYVSMHKTDLVHTGKEQLKLYTSVCPFSEPLTHGGEFIKFQVFNRFSCFYFIASKIITFPVNSIVIAYL